MHVIATAGHVDHGKSTLVRALTGMEPDRWAEERRRGMTIDLGFAWTELLGGEVVAFVDVPGHERFVGNMLAGVGPVPAVMMVVAADEGWMPQSAEHIAVIDALRVRHGVLAVTRCDLADDAVIAATEATARRHIAATSLGDVESVRVSATTGSGLDELRSALTRLTSRLPQPDTTAPVRLWVDRAFTIRGAGTVITGTLAAGSLRVGDELELVPSGRRVQVRGLESLKTRQESVRGVARVAVNLRHVPVEEVRRGAALLTPGTAMLAGVVDVRVDGPLPREGLLHVGSAAVRARVRPFGPEAARLTLASALPLRIGDRGLLRDPGRRAVAGATVLDVRPPVMTRRGSAHLRRAELAEMSETPDPAAELRRRRVVDIAELRAMGCDLPTEPKPLAGRWLIDDEHRAELSDRLVAAVDAHRAARPLDSGLSLEAARQELDLPDRRLVEALVAPPLAVRDGRVLRASDADVLPPDVLAAVDALRRDLADAPFAATDHARLADAGLDRAGLAAAVRLNLLLRVGDGIYLGPDATELAAKLLAELPQPFTVSAARQALDTTRRVAVPLLEMLDRAGVTKRIDPLRRQVVAADSPQPAAT